MSFLLLSFFSTFASASVTLTSSYDGTQVTWFWPASFSEKRAPLWDKTDLVNASWSTDALTKLELVTFCYQHDSNDTITLSEDVVLPSDNKRVALNVDIGPDYPYLCSLDFRDLEGTSLQVPSDGFYISGESSTERLVHSEGDTAAPLDVSTDSSSSSSSSSTSTTTAVSVSPSGANSTSSATAVIVTTAPALTSTASESLPAPSSRGVRPGAVAGIAVGVAVLVLGAGFLAFYFFARRASRRQRRRREDEQALAQEMAAVSEMGTAAPSTTGNQSAIGWRSTISGQ